MQCLIFTTLHIVDKYFKYMGKEYVFLLQVFS